MMLDRRQFLSVAAAGAALTLLGTTGVASDTSAEPIDSAPPELLVAIGADAVREIGEAYRKLVPAESDATALRAALQAVRSSNEDPVRADFAAGRVIVVSDWMLSHTEARQCALFSLRPA
jgi:hypothetical protein